MDNRTCNGPAIGIVVTTLEYDQRNPEAETRGFIPKSKPRSRSTRYIVVPGSAVVDVTAD